MNQTLSTNDAANEYLKHHKILEIFENTTAQLIYHRPNNPKEFLIEKIQEIQKSQALKQGHSCLFDESDVNAVIRVLDPIGRGFINYTQYTEAMKTLGVTTYNTEPVITENGLISVKIFAEEVKAGLLQQT